MTPHRVVITGLGAITPYGIGVKSLWNGLLSSKSALAFNKKLGIVCGQLSPEHDEKLNEFSKKYRNMNRTSLFGLIAAEEAMIDAGLLNQSHVETGTHIGVGFPDLEEIASVSKQIEDGKERKVSPYFIPKILTNIPSSYIAMEHQLFGGNWSSAAACATGVMSIGDAYSNIKYGRVKKMLGGAIDTAVNPMTKVGFQRLRALSKIEDPEVASKPFDSKRDGFLLSEGGGIVVLERLEDALERKATIYGEILGFGFASDAFHLTSPREDGLGSLLCMQKCLDEAKVSASVVDYINAHATSTPVGDKIEAQSIGSMFGKINVSSFKGHVGHCMAGAGAIETIGTVLAIKNGILPGTLNFKETDFEHDLNILGNSIKWENERKVSIVNSFGFGGIYASLCLSSFIN
uniref:Beta-ketoacyl-[acyl-carrier-protein] synthase I n=1 Tax=Rhabditophanes sp. KR3021 TaxID=114890 RepID=A0AC35TJ33_9BILA